MLKYNEMEIKVAYLSLDISTMRLSFINIRQTNYLHVIWFIQIDVEHDNLLRVFVMHKIWEL